MSTPIAEKGWYYNHVNAFAENTLLRLQTPVVRDLAWSCFSAPLILATELGDETPIGNCRFTLSPKRCEWLQTLDADPRPLHAHLAASQTQRLGLYFERLWHFFLTEDEHVELLAHNLPVREGAHTLGEFDCLYYCHHRQQHVHLELAVKFYLGAPGTQQSNWHNWLGPASKDRLDLKMQRMLHHQLRLADTPAGAEVLRSLGVVETLRELEIKGRLFSHFRHPAPPPPGYNHVLPLQVWCYAGELADCLEEKKLHYLLLDRSQWLASLNNPRVSGAGDTAHSGTPNAALATRFKEILSRHKRPLQIAGLDEHGLEQRRLFLVADDWPASDA